MKKIRFTYESALAAERIYELIGVKHSFFLENEEIDFTKIIGIGTIFITKMVLEVVPRDVASRFKKRCENDDKNIEEKNFKQLKALLQVFQTSVSGYWSNRFDMNPNDEEIKKVKDIFSLDTCPRIIQVILEAYVAEELNVNLKDVSYFIEKSKEEKSLSVNSMSNFLNCHVPAWYSNEFSEKGQFDICR